MAPRGGARDPGRRDVGGGGTERRADRGRSSMTVTVPGNLLLMGEYAALEEGGLAVAIAVDRHVTLRVRPAGRFTAELLRADGRTEWHAGSTSEHSRLIEKLFEFESSAASGALSHSRELPPVSMQIDSRALFSRDGVKLGFGSSAAVTVAFLAALSGLASYDAPKSPRDTRGDLPAVSLQRAVLAHRFFQNGKGSGYDVAASLYGGIGLFRGGKEPAWEPLVERSCLYRLPLRCIHRAVPVATPAAVAQYERWKHNDPRRAAAFLARSNELVMRFAAASSPAEARDAWLDARALGIGLGREIGVPAEVDDLSERTRGAGSFRCKAAGAGNELAVCIDFDEAGSEQREGPPAPANDPDGTSGDLRRATGSPPWLDELTLARTGLSLQYDG